MRAKTAVLITFVLLAGCAEDPKSVEELVAEQNALLESIATDLSILRGGVNLDLATLDEYAGRYEARGFTSLVFERQGRELWVTNDNGDRLRVVPTTDNEFELLLSKGYHYTFAPDGSGRLDATDGPIVRHYQRVE